MAASTIRSVAQVTRHPFATMMSSRTRSLGSWTRSTHEGAFADFATNGKQVKVVATLFLEGLDVSELKSVLPVVQQHLSSIRARKAVVDHLGSLNLNEHKTARVGYTAEVNFEGYKNSEVEPLGPWVEQYTSVSADALPKETETMSLRIW